MSTEENKAVFRRFAEEVISKHAADAIGEVWATDALLNFAGVPGPIRGDEAIKGLASAFFTAFPDLQQIVDQQVAEGDWVVTRWTMRGTQQGEFQGVPPTGKQATWTGMSMSRIVDGKIVEDWVQMDVVGLLQQLGAIPTPDQATS